MKKLTTTVCIVGGGPAGMMAGFLFARAGIATVVLEKHKDFLRDFRGDTIHPSTTEILSELGLLDDFLKMSPSRLARLRGQFGKTEIDVADFSGLPTACKFIALIPQWDFLNFLAKHASALDTFTLKMETEAVDLMEDHDRVTGVRASSPQGDVEIESSLVIAADGRSSQMRSCAGFKVNNIGAPMDVLWFRVPRSADTDGDTLLHAGSGHIVITINRNDYWQCAYVIPKGTAEAVKRDSFSDFKNIVRQTAPVLAGGLDELSGFDEVKLLSVAIDRLEHWSRPGLLMIGDSAHAMSPIGGVGINLAIQDAVAAANLLSDNLREGSLSAADLESVRRRRLWPTKITQWFQVKAQDRIVKPVFENRLQQALPPLPLRIISRSRFLQRKVGAMIGLGARPEHVRPGRHAAAATSA